MKTKNSKTRQVHPEPPTELSATSAALWRRVLAAGKCGSASTQEMLLLALLVRDRAAELRVLVRDEGLVAENLATRTKHVHPAARLLVESEKQFSRLWQLLGLATTPSSYTLCGSADLAEALAAEE